MTRPLLALLLLTATPLHAETIMASATLTHVTLYPEGAMIERQVTVDLPPGQHELLIADLPFALAVYGVSLELPENLGLVSQTVLHGRLPADMKTDLPALAALDDSIARQKASLRDAKARIGQIEARAEAARAKARALQAMLSGAALPTEPAALSRLSDMVQAETLTALQTAKTAEAEILDEKARLEPSQQALDKALADRQDLEDRSAKRTTLALTLNSAGGEATILLRNRAMDASTTGWSPNYEAFLTTGPQPSLFIDRAVSISQSTGEDWRNVSLTLSTAEPAQHPAPSNPHTFSYTLVPEPKEDEETDAYSDSNECDPGCGGPVVVSDNALLSDKMVGQTLEYTFPTKITVRDDTDHLVLALDDLTLPAENFVLVTDSYGADAYLMASFTNSTDEMLLPGDALVYRDGVLMGQELLDLVLPGQKGELGFGTLKTIVVTKGWPERMQGSRGLFVTETETSKTSVISIENRSDQPWPLVIRAGIPQSEHEELVITYAAEPAETLRNKDGRPGLMEWQTDLAAGATYRIEYGHTMRWPEGMIVQ